LKQHPLSTYPLRLLGVPILICILFELSSCVLTNPGRLVATPTLPVVQSTGAALQPDFTPEEKAWIAEHPVIHMGVEQNFPPYELIDDNGVFTGVSADYRTIISQRLGIDIQVESFSDFSIIHDHIKNKNLDLVLLLTPTAERKEFLLFTQPFFDYQLVIVTRDDFPVVFNLDDFLGKTVAVVEGYASSEYISQKYPQLQISTYPTVEAGLIAVSTGKADAFVNEVFATVYQIRNKSLSNLKIAAQVDTDLPGYAIGVRNDWPELVSILNKVLVTISPEERLQISEKWLSVKYERGFDYSLLWKVIVGAALILGVFIYWNRRLSNEVAIRKQIEEDLRESEKNYRLLFERSTSAIAVLTMAYDDKGNPYGYNFLDVNPTFELLTGFKRKQVVGQNTLSVLPGYDQYWSGLYERVQDVGEAATFDQYFAPLDRYFQGIAYSPQPGQFAISFMDITQRKRVEDELRKYQHHLEELVQERTTDLESKNTVLAIEITERQRVQQELEESESNLRAMAENASDAILIAVGDKGNYIFANRRAEELTGRSRTELYELRILDLVHSSEHQNILNIYQSRVHGDQSPDRYETVYLQKNGTEIPVEITAAWIHWQGEVALMAIVRDISERKKVEAEIIQQNYELEVLAEISNIIRNTHQPDELAALILERTVALSGMAGGGLALFEKGQLILVAKQNQLETIDLLNDELKEYLLGALSFGQPIYINEMGNGVSLNTGNRFGHAFAPELNAWIVIPLKSFDNPIGVIALFSSQPKSYTSQIRRLMSAIADIAGNALERVHTMATLEERVTDRTRDLSTLYQVMTIANQSDQLDQILDQALNLALKAVSCQAGFIYLLDASKPSLKPAVIKDDDSLNLDGLWSSLPASALATEIITENQSVLVTDLSLETRIPKTTLGGVCGELIGIPLQAAGMVLGVLWGYSEQVGHLTLEDITLMASIGERIGTTVENFRLRARTQQVAVLEERQRLARDLHDSVTQQIYSLLLFVGGAKKSLSMNDVEKTLQLANRIEVISRQALKELRLLIFELRPLDLMQVGLVEALRQRLESVEQRGGTHAQLITQIDARIPAEVEEELYRIAIEALNNSVKHAAAANVEIQLKANDGMVELKVLDNGVGFIFGKEQHGGSGILSMHERARKIGAAIKIDTGPGIGTLVSVIVEEKNG
jgi:PAS domain S-box-containing protein